MFCWLQKVEQREPGERRVGKLADLVFTRADATYIKLVELTKPESWEAFLFGLSPAAQRVARKCILTAALQHVVDFYHRI
eukprot:3803831-Pyramimonas_sp.AAC.1